VYGFRAVCTCSSVVCELLVREVSMLLQQVDMPVFFYIDPDFCEDPKMEKVNAITLSYTFFEAKEGQNLTLPNYYRPHPQ